MRRRVLPEVVCSLPKCGLPNGLPRIQQFTLYSAAAAAVCLQCVRQPKKVQDGSGLLHRPAGRRHGQEEVRRRQEQTAYTRRRTDGSGQAGLSANQEGITVNAHFFSAWRRDTGYTTSGRTRRRIIPASCIPWHFGNLFRGDGSLLSLYCSVSTPPTHDEDSFGSFLRSLSGSASRTGPPRSPLFRIM